MKGLISAGSTGVELGTQGGFFAEFILTNLKPRELWVVDTDLGQLEVDLSRHEAVRLWEGKSGDFLQEMEEGSFDFIYVDASHWWPNVSEDARLSKALVRPGGLLIFNDYTTWSPIEAEPYGVLRAVNETLVAGGFLLEAIGLHPGGYHDVALRRVD